MVISKFIEISFKSQISVVFVSLRFHKADLLLKYLDWRQIYTNQRIKQDMESICPISDVLVLSFKIIKDWICHKAVSIFLKTEREWEETEIKIYKRKCRKEKGLHKSSTSLYERQKTERLFTWWGPDHWLGYKPGSSWVVMLSTHPAPLLWLFREWIAKALGKGLLQDQLLIGTSP